MPDKIETGCLTSDKLRKVVFEYNKAVDALNAEMQTEIRQKLDSLYKYTIKNRKELGDSHYYVYIDTLGVIMALIEGRTDWNP